MMTGNVILAAARLLCVPLAVKVFFDAGLVKQFLRDVDWGHQDFLIVDTPPGTSDEHITIAQYLKATQPDGVIIVTTPQQVSIIDVRKEINFCKKARKLGGVLF